MFSSTVSFICSEWGIAVKTVLLIIVSTVLLAVICLLVAESIGKRETIVGVPQDDNDGEAVAPDRTDDASAVGSESEQKPEKAPEPSAESESAASADEIEPDETATFEDDDNNNETGTMIVGDSRIRVRYNRSFTAMLIQADDTLKGLYSELRNELMAYKLKQRMSWSAESWYFGRTTYAKFAIRGKTLSLYLALDPEKFENTKYVFNNVRDTAKYRDVPMRVKVKSDRAARWAKELVAAMAERYGLARVDTPKRNFRPDYRDTKSLVKDKLIKLQYVASPDKSKQELESAAAADLKAKDKAPRDFSTKLMRADSQTKARYSAIKNELLRYGMKPRLSTSFESWYMGRTTYAKFAIRGKTLTLYMALDPQEFESTKYNFRNVGTVGKYETVPMRVNLKSDRSVRWVKELLATLAQKKGWERADRREEDFRYVKKTKKKK